uniref:Uncharacterized protein n=1 Tax=Acanthochromis polyacanthus TaxID=80966 RepID=A0A3Q1F682_9TELE
MVLNTEFEKASSAKSTTEAEVTMVSEDRLVDELMKQKLFVFFFYNQLKYILDTDRPGSELIVKTQKSCLTRADFWGLGLNNEIESTVSLCLIPYNCELIMFGKSIFVVDLYVVATWRPPTSCDPLSSLPVSVTCPTCFYSNYISCSLNPGNWTEKTGLQIQGFPGQPYRIDCGVFMLMNALYTILDAPYDFTIVS